MSENPFRPGMTVNPEYFVGREKEIEAYKASLVQSQYGNTQHIAIMGERGIGKSSLLRKFEAVTDKEEHLVIRRDLDASLGNIEGLINFLLVVLKSQGTQDVKGRISDFFKEYSWNVSAAGFGLSLDKKSGIAFQEFFYNELRKISENIQDEYKSICIMLDEAEHLESINGSWSFLRTVFSRLNENGYYYLIIVAGKLGLFDHIKEIFSPLERFFYPWEIGPLSKEEVTEMISRPFIEKGGEIVKSVIQEVYDLSAGFPFVVQVIGFHLYQTEEKVISKKIFKDTWPDILNRLEVQIFKSRYDIASPNEKKVLREMSEKSLKEHSAKDISEELDISSSQISSIFGRLVQKNNLVKVEYGRYKIFHPLYGSYIKKRYEHEK